MKGRIRSLDMEYRIREMNEDEYPLLNDFLYEAIYIPEGAEMPPKSIINASCLLYTSRCV